MSIAVFIQRYRRLLFIAIIVLAVGVIGGIVARRQTDQPPTSPDAEQIITYSTDQPSETKPDIKADYKVAPNKPRLISVPAIGVEGFVQQVGVDQHKAIAVPSNTHMVGWFVKSQLPGAPGLSIIDGHLDGQSSGGIFEHLAQLKVGEQFSVGFGDGSTKDFVVRRVQSATVAETAAILFSQELGITSQLNLVTCDGTYDKSEGQYDKRVVVMGELVEGL